MYLSLSHMILSYTDVKEETIFLFFIRDQNITEIQVTMIFAVFRSYKNVCGNLKYETLHCNNNTQIKDDDNMI